MFWDTEISKNNTIVFHGQAPILSGTKSDYKEIRIAINKLNLFDKLFEDYKKTIEQVEFDGYTPTAALMLIKLIEDSMK